MHGTATGLIAVALAGDGPCAHIRIRPPGHRLPLGIGAQILALKIAQLVLRAEILGRKPRAALEPNDLHASLAELGRENAARRAHPDNDDVGSLGCHGSLLCAVTPPTISQKLGCGGNSTCENFCGAGVVGALTRRPSARR